MMELIISLSLGQNKEKLILLTFLNMIINLNGNMETILNTDTLISISIEMIKELMIFLRLQCF